MINKSGEPFWNRSYGYDSVGNRTSMSLIDIQTPLTLESTTYAYEDNNELNYRVVSNGSSQIKHDYSFDAAGNMSAVEQLTCR